MGYIDKLTVDDDGRMFIGPWKLMPFLVCKKL
jgi:hypothetical protein